MDKKWDFSEINEPQAKSLAAQLNIHPTLGGLLINRGITDFEKARSFFRPSLDMLHDPFLMKDLSLAVNRLSDALARNESILIYGDYDVDGTTSVALMYSFLKNHTENIRFYIPDRYAEGYGISEQGIEYAASIDCQLIIALDCGIRALNMADLSKKKDIDLIICDHHIPGSVLPKAYAVLDPKRKDCRYPFKELSGCGVGFKLLQGFCLQHSLDLESLFSYLDLVAVSIASDIVPMVGENRILAYFGMQKINSQPLKSLQALIDIAGIKAPISVSDVVFYIGPRINAAGRLRHAHESVDLLISEDPVQLKEFAQRLNEVNKKRQNIDQTVTEEALRTIHEELPVIAKSTVLFNPKWHKGIVGIVASRCIEHYFRPTIILTENNGVATGSARSVEGFDIHAALGKCADLLLQYGGHAFAAGMSLALNKVDLFKDRFEEIVKNTIPSDSERPKLIVDAQVPLDFIQFKNFNILNQMTPFGPQNMQPVFVTEHVNLVGSPKIIKGKHLKLQVKQDDTKVPIEAIAFGLGGLEAPILAAESFRMAYHIDLNEFQGRKRLQLIVKDIKFSN